MDTGLLKMPNTEISIVLPCLNEEKAIGMCLDNINKVIIENKLDAEVIVVDNGSTDKSKEIVKRKQAKLRALILIEEKQRGYGSAYLHGFREAKGKYIFMADSDGSYNFSEIPKFIKELRAGYDFVIGNRFKGEIEKGAMPFSHRYIGNPILSAVLRVFFKTKIKDAHCGMRAITRSALDKLNLKTTGMEFASEMIIKAAKNNLKIKELPINYQKRAGNSKLKSFPDGWRHLRFMLLYCPLFLFFIPGLILFLLGLLSLLWMYFGTPEVLGTKLYYHPMFLSSLLVIVGYQLIIFALFAKTYAATHLGEKNTLQRLYKHITIEKASIIGIIITLFGIIIYLTIFIGWVKSEFSGLEQVKNSILALTLIVVGIQTIFSSFMLSILGIKEK